MVSSSTMDEIVRGQEIPDRNPIVLTDKDDIIKEDFLSLCALGPSFIPVPTSYDWLQLQKDFDKFKNTLRAHVFFHNNSTYNGQEAKQSGPPKKPSTWRAPTSRIPEVEVFISSVERDLFDTSKCDKFIVDNITPGQRSALNQ